MAFKGMPGMEPEQDVLQDETCGNSRAAGRKKENERDEFQNEAYRMELQAEGIKHTRYVKEQEWLLAIEQGTLEADRIPSEESSFQDVGILSKRGARKQVEYAALSGICLAARAAIRGGVNPERAYSIADLGLQRLSEGQTTRELMAAFQETVGMLVSKVRKTKEQRRNSFYTEQCMDYVERNFTRKFTIQEMARDLGLSRTYLSETFSRQTGETIISYIRKRRLETARMLLLTSAMDIGEIAEFLCFNSQSHFGKCFKEEYKVTPLQYRNHEGIIDSAGNIQREP